MIDQVKKTVKDNMDKAVASLLNDLKKVRTGRANVSMLDPIRVNYYGQPTPLNQVAALSCPDAKSFLIAPWEAPILKEIESAIVKSDIGMTPINDGKVIRLKVPELTEERRRDLVKGIKKTVEDARVAIRMARRDANEELKKGLKDKALSEDQNKKGQEDIQKMTDDFIKKVDQIAVDKEKRIDDPLGAQLNRPKHVAIIMDGNGRWAQARGRDRIYGHIKGARVARQMIEHCASAKIKYLTLFTFSSENWFRPKGEVLFLMSLLAHHLRRQRRFLLENNIKFCCVGDLSQIPEVVLGEVERTIEMTAQNTGMVLTFALSYGGRQEIVQAAKDISVLVKEGSLDIDDIDEALLASKLESHYMPDPDLVIRTSGESRLSNFMLWQTAYSELYFTSCLWPNFTIEEFNLALDFYKSRKRRFGRIDESAPSPEPAN